MSERHALCARPFCGDIIDYAGFTFFNERKNVPRVLEPAQAIAARLHDTAQERAVREFLQGRDVVAIMGGHDFKRQPEAAEIAAKGDVYWDCVSIAKQLTERGYLVLTGGGPGLMEAGNLGALLAGEDAATIADVKALLVNEKFEDAGWRRTGMQARERILGAWDAQAPPAKFSLGIPTWFYCHEPPNMFASHHSKMFYNSPREDGLVTLANRGIVFFEGNAGTVQEVFQDAAQNYYVGPGQSPTPMIFYSAGGYWERACDALSNPTDSPMDKRKPLMPLMRQLAAEKNFGDALLVTTSVDETMKFIVDANAAPPAQGRHAAWQRRAIVMTRARSQGRSPRHMDLWGLLRAVGRVRNAPRRRASRADGPGNLIPCSRTNARRRSSF